MQNPSDPFAFLKAQWPDLGSSFQLPQAAMSSMDPQVIDKRIEDLKTVEQWLSFNLNLVKTSIQGLEVQKGTLEAIRSFQKSMEGFGQPNSSQTTDDHAADPDINPLNQAAMRQASDWWNGVQNQFQHFVTAAQQAAPQAKPSSTRAPKRPKETANVKPVGQPAGSTSSKPSRTAARQKPKT